MYLKYKGFVTDRAYEGQKIEAEIKHLTGLAKNQITVSAIDDKARTATVTFSATPTLAKGAVENGTLVNNGEVKYSDKTWNEFVYCLAKAVKTAQEAKTGNHMNTYVAKKELVLAENALALPDDAIWYTVSGTVYEAVDGTGKIGSTTLAGVDVYVNGSKVTATAADGTFTAKKGLKNLTNDQFKQLLKTGVNYNATL